MGRKVTYSEGTKEQTLAYLSVKWGLKKQEWGINRGDLILPNGQKLLETGKNEFERSIFADLSKMQMRNR